MLWIHLRKSQRQLKELIIHQTGVSSQASEQLDRATVPEPFDEDSEILDDGCSEKRTCRYCQYK